MNELWESKLTGNKYILVSKSGKLVHDIEISKKELYIYI